jgi:glucose-6-phosphate isomerase
MTDRQENTPAGRWSGPDPEIIGLLHKYNKNLRKTPLPVLLAQADRFGEFSRAAAGLTLDLSRVHLDGEALGLLLSLARKSGLKEAREQLFSGQQVNNTEHRPAFHMALRSDALLQSSKVEGAHRVQDSMRRMLEFAGILHQRVLPADRQAIISDIVHVGIGGSLLGTRLVYEALGAGADGPRLHFLGSVDAHHREALLPGLDPASTAVVVVSKSFTTADTLMHARRLRRWLEDRLGATAARQRMFAVTEKQERTEADGFLPGQVMFLPAWVGGRYSLWSPVSLSAAAAIGPAVFRELLDGGAAMDQHFRQASLADNLPVLMGLTGIWHRNICAYPAWGVIPYDQRLRLLPAPLQQVIMESNGKSVTVAGAPAGYGTAPLVFGESGTEAQHSLFQALHQGTDVVPVNFVGVIRPDHDDQDAHDELLANLLAQATALAVGRGERETLKQIAAEGGDAAELLPHRSFGGNRPSEILLLDRLSPACLGSLLALYEHKVFVESVIWGINAFDQWGVELGKQLAPDIRAGLNSGNAAAPGLEDLLRYIRSRR